MTRLPTFRTETRTVDPLNAGREIDDGKADILKVVGGDRQRAEVGGHWDPTAFAPLCLLFHFCIRGSEAKKRNMVQVTAEESL